MAFDFTDSHVVRPSHRLHKKASIKIIGTSRTTMAGNVRKIIGTPASAKSGNGGSKLGTVRMVRGYSKRKEQPLIARARSADIP